MPPHATTSSHDEQHDCSVSVTHRPTPYAQNSSSCTLCSDFEVTQTVSILTFNTSTIRSTPQNTVKCKSQNTVYNKHQTATCFDTVAFLRGSYRTKQYQSNTLYRPHWNH